SSDSKDFAINKAGQTISFTGPAAQYYGTGSVLVSATGGGSGNHVTFTASPASVCGSSGTYGATILLNGVGTCAVIANQAGNGNYNAAPAVQRSFAVNPDPTAITLDTTKTSGANFNCGNQYT